MNVTFSGYVERGEGIATGLGCPTANLPIAHGAMIPGLGVYVASAELSGKTYPSVVCVSDGRTGNNLKLEVHFLGEYLELRGKFITVRLLEKRRGLVPWEGPEAMKTQIQEDVRDAKEWFARLSETSSNKQPLTK